MNTQQAYPLSWPASWPRCTFRRVSNFADRSVDAATRALFNELRNLGVANYNVVLSTNLVLRNDGLPRSDQRNPQDPGVAVYFRFKDKPTVLACDKWTKVEDNLWALAKHIEALRGQQRWGVGSVEQAFAGYTALPAPGDSTAATWYNVLGVSANATLEQAREAYIAEAKKCHPDNGGSTEAMQRLNHAWNMARRSFA